MLADASVPGTDDWYLVRLCNQLGEGLPRMHRLTKYRDGDALIPVNMWDGMRESYMQFLRKSRLHIVETIRDARTNRQEVIGVRTAAAGDEAGDQVAARLLALSQMDIQFEQLFNDTADYGEAFVLTIPQDGAEPIYNVRNGWDTAAIPDRLRPWLTEAGVTIDFDPINEREVAILYRPGYYRIAYRDTKVPTLPKNGSRWAAAHTEWTWEDEREYTPETDQNLLTRTQTPDGIGVYEKHLDTVDRINEITLNGLTLIVMQSFRQRAIQGTLPTHYPEGHPNAGQEIDYDELFKAGPSALWLLPETAKIWESAATDVRPIYEARKNEVQTLASLTATPQYVFSSESANQSATGAELAREQLVFAVRRMNKRQAASARQYLSVGFFLMGDLARADVTQIEIMFAKINPSTMQERADAAPKFKAGGATQRIIDEQIFELTPAERRQAEEDRVTEAFTAGLAGGTSGSDSGSNPQVGGSLRV